MFLDLQQGTDGLQCAGGAWPRQRGVSGRRRQRAGRSPRWCRATPSRCWAPRPAVGRFFTAAEDGVPGAQSVHRAERRVLAAALQPRAVGRRPVVVVNATPMTIIGVAAPGFTGVLANDEPAFFVPTVMKAQMTPTRDDLDRPPVALAEHHRPARAGRHPRAGQGRRRRALPADQRLRARGRAAVRRQLRRVQGPLPRQDPGAARRLAWPVADPRRHDRAGRGADGDGRAGAAHRLRQRRQPDAGAGHRPAARDERAPRPRRRPGPPGASDAGRERAGRRARRTARAAARRVARRRAGRRAAARRVRRHDLDHARPRASCCFTLARLGAHRAALRPGAGAARRRPWI